MEQVDNHIHLRASIANPTGGVCGESDSQCFMVQGNDSLEVQSESQLDSFDASSSCDENIDAHALNEELSIVCEKLFEKYKILKKKSLGIVKENKILHSRLDIVL